MAQLKEKQDKLATIEAKVTSLISQQNYMYSVHGSVGIPHTRACIVFFLLVKE